MTFYFSYLASLSYIFPFLSSDLALLIGAYYFTLVFPIAVAGLYAVVLTKNMTEQRLFMANLLTHFLPALIMTGFIFNYRARIKRILNQHGNMLYFLIPPILALTYMACFNMEEVYPGMRNKLLVVFALSWVASVVLMTYLVSS